MDHTVRSNFFPGLSVKIISDNNQIIEGKVKEILTLVEIDPAGIFVKLETGEVGNTIEIIQTASEMENNNLISEFIRNFSINEGRVLEYKESFSYPTDPEKKLSEITKEDKKFVRFLVAKTIAAFANAFGGTLYVGVKDKPREIKGLDRDFKLLESNKQDADGLGLKIKSVLEPFFSRGSRIFENVKIRFIKYQNFDICIITVKRSDVAFIPNFDSNDYFFVRHDDDSRKYTANQFLDYWPKHLEESTQL